MFPDMETRRMYFLVVFEREQEAFCYQLDQSERSVKHHLHVFAPLEPISGVPSPATDKIGRVAA